MAEGEKAEERVSRSAIGGIMRDSMIGLCPWQTVGSGARQKDDDQFISVVHSDIVVFLRRDFVIYAQSSGCLLAMLRVPVERLIQF